MIVDGPEAQVEQLLAETDTLSWDENSGRPDMAHHAETHHFDRIMALKYLVMGALRPRVKSRTVGERPVSRGRSFRI
jgi:hypothetical protein